MNQKYFLLMIEDTEVYHHWGVTELAANKEQLTCMGVVNILPYPFIPFHGYPSQKSE